jgi:HK97 gp10 family phage protein
MRKNTVVKGIEDVLKTIQRIQTNTGKRIPEVEEKAALEIELEAAETVQVDTSRLKTSIQSYKTTDGYEVSAGGEKVDGVEVEYAGALEFGTSRSRAYPFMRPAAAKVGKKYPDLIISGVNDSFKNAGVK